MGLTLITREDGSTGYEYLEEDQMREKGSHAALLPTLHSDDRSGFAGQFNRALAGEDEDGRKLPGFSSFPGGFKRVKSDPQSIVYQWEIANQLRIERHYTREDNSTYVFEHKTSITNLSQMPLALDRAKLNLGSAFRMPRLYNPFDNATTYLNVGYYNAGLPLAEGCSCAECSGRIDGEKEEFFQYQILSQKSSH